MADTENQIYVIHCIDRPDSKDKRMEGLKAHLAHVDEVFDRIHLAGPMHDSAGGFMGSLLVISAKDESDARAFLESDPYFKADIWERITISRMGVKLGSWVGGKPW
ncbi:YciI family protein [Sandaracinobacteroides sp. A072]|uniref:YciI family protein n=1 Tax=Sandaracinobacteroides sp. A072 TaxID=3461146 RepID=UPI0040419D6A